MRHVLLTFALGAAALAQGCRDATSPVEDSEPARPLITDDQALVPILTGTLTVVTSTTGADLDPDGYTVTVDESRQAIATNGSVTFSGLSVGSHTVALSGEAANCSTQGDNPRSELVVVVLTTRTQFDVRCVAAQPPPPPPPPPPREATRLAFTRQPTDAEAGTTLNPVEVAAQDDSGNIVTSYSGSITVAIGNNPGGGVLSGTTTMSAVSGVARFSDLSIDRAGQGYTLTATASGLTGSTSTPFNITAAQPPPPPPPPPSGIRVVGRGALGTGPAQPGGERVEFDFEATDSPDGRAALTDYSVVRADGTVGRMTVDNAGDPETGVSSFERTSATCVRFGGIGRLDTGELQRFFIDACDNASPGAGADTFTVELPDRPFRRTGTLSEGDIVIS